MSASKSLVSDLKLSGRLFQILGPTEYKLWISRFVFRKGSFNFLLEEHVIALLSPTGEETLLKWLGHWLYKI